MTMNSKPAVIIRPEREEDYRRTEEVARDAFWNLYRPGAEEHYVVHHMRRHPDFMPELSFVLEIDGIVQGGIFYTRSSIVTAQGAFPTISFGPVFIAPSHHRQGLGRMLITHSMNEARRRGHTAILTLGYPYHYSPYGFQGGRRFGITLADGKYHIGLLVLPLREGALDGVHGHVEFSRALDAEPGEVEAFDAAFPYREKLVLPCQKIYEEACAMLEE